MEAIRADFDRIAAAGGAGLERVDERARAIVEGWPEGLAVLDVGCGAGALARHLAARARRVVGIDLSPVMCEKARAATAGMPGVEIVEGDFRRWEAGERFDAIVSVATLHHVELEEGIEAMRARLSPGGRLAVVDLFAAWLPYDVIAGLARRLRPAWPRRVDPAITAAWKAHEAHDHHLPFPEIRRRVLRVLPDAVVRRHLDWRYSVVWTR